MLHQRCPAIRIVVLTTFPGRRLLLGALQRGASAYVLKDADVAELARIIRAVRRGGSGFDGRSAQLVVRSLTEPDEGNRLTPRELDVVRRVTSGAANPQIARDLYVSESTVKQYMRAAMRELGARDRTGLAYRAGKPGVVQSLGGSARCSAPMPAVVRCPGGSPWCGARMVCGAVPGRGRCIALPGTPGCPAGKFFVPDGAVAGAGMRPQRD
jgi:DNA-binding CsgD family transcriptional regulator